MTRWVLVLVTAAAAACNPPCAEIGAVCTIAGTGVAGYNGEGLEARATWLFYPSALAFDSSGRLIINDYNNYRIRRLGDDDHITTVVGLGLHAYAVPGPADESPLENAIDIDLADDGTMYVAEQHSGRILKIADDELSIVAGSGDVGYGGDGGPALDAALDYTAGVEVHPDGRVFIADTNNHVIREVGTDGNIRLLAGAPEEHGFVDGTFAEARFDEPQHMHLDGDLLYVADSRNEAVRKLDLLAGTVTTIAGTGDAGFSGDGGPAIEAQLDTPVGVMVDDDGRIWITDSDNHVVRRIETDGTIDTVLGSGVEGGLLDGDDPLACTFDYPVDAIIGPDGNLYVADMLNSAVREMVLTEPE